MKLGCSLQKYGLFAHWGKLYCPSLNVQKARSVDGGHISWRTMNKPSMYPGNWCKGSLYYTFYERVSDRMRKMVPCSLSL